MTVAGIEIDSLSADDARLLIMQLQHHIRDEEASMTPAQLHEHLREVPDKLAYEVGALWDEIESKVFDAVEDYVYRHGNWWRAEYEDDYCDEETGEFDRAKVEDEYYPEIRRLTDTLLAKLFNTEEIDA